MGVQTSEEKIANRSTIQGPPAPAFELDPMPAEVVRAFPKLAEWQRAQNQRFKEYSLKLNQTFSQFQPQ